MAKKRGRPIKPNKIIRNVIGPRVRKEAHIAVIEGAAERGLSLGLFIEYLVADYRERNGQEKLWG